MDNLRPSAQLDVEHLLEKIVDDFEHLERAIESAIARIKDSGGLASEVASLERARLAARRGAALARQRIVPNQDRF